jgi:hypothetical protein
MSSLSPSMQFYDSAVPALPAGPDYTLTVTQSVLPEGSDCTQAYVFTQALVVDGPHIGLGPDDVVSVYPPAGSQTDYSESLAHVVLNRRSLPWEINPGVPTTVPWMALLLLAPGEILWAGVPGSGSGAQTVAVSDYLTPPQNYVVPEIEPSEQTAWTDQYGSGAKTNVVDIPWDAFNAIAPQLAELPWLAHVRQINTGGTSITGTDDEDGWYGVVVGNRLPNGTGMFAAHLVSLEGMTGFLPGPGQTPPAASQNAVRLISLASWTFNTVPGPNFTQLMEALSADVLQMPAPEGAPSNVVTSALAGGYTALEYQTRLGEPTTAWYRGPALPVLMAANPQPPYPSADAALLYDPTTGMFDVSLAVAWQTGRLLALANRQFVASLLSWVNQNNAVQQRLLSATRFLEDHPFLDSPRDPVELLEPGAIYGRVRGYLAETLAARWSADASRPPLAPPVDPTGLRLQVGRLRGLLPRAAVESILAEGIEPNAGVVAAVRRQGGQP